MPAIASVLTLASLPLRRLSTRRPLPNRPSNRLSHRRRLSGLLASLLVLPPLGWSPPARAVDELVVRFDGLELPIELVELEAWIRDPGQTRGDLAQWLNLLDARSRRGLARLLQAPLLTDRSFATELLGSWTGEQMLREVGGLVTGPRGESTAPLLMDSLRRRFERQTSVTAVELLRELPIPRVTLQVDGLLALAQHWRAQLQHQRDAVAELRRLPLPLRQTRPLLGRSRRSRPAQPQRLQLAVAHRPMPLPVDLWPALGPAQSEPRPLLLLMPGLGGSRSQLNWLAASLAEQGWPALVLEHPGSDEQAVKASLVGEGPLPGAESLPQRLADLEAVLAARAEGRLPPLGPAGAGDAGVVLIGHSLGGLTALMAAGLVPEQGLSGRCRRALTSLPLTNVSRLLQCQLEAVAGDGGPRTAPGAADPWPQLAGIPLLGVVTFNGFGSLLWPERGLADLPLPVLMVGGSLDLITPPVQEQLGLLSTSGHPRSRLVLVDGASHFSPVRLEGDGEVLFRVGEQLVGQDPELVQELLLRLTVDFLESARHGSLLMPQRRRHGGVEAYVLDRDAARQWQRRLPADPAPLKAAAPGAVLRTGSADRAGPPAGPPSR
ncbi:alpha/beta hydrolase [Cyanobium sp. CH-040]|uniref:alpha/beta hydrolase n=1 Tax=Cyanobium sp. CH-040 TaxID=2823708 RepID=UPI0020CE18D8|nr:alpha/beta hydrolase [Cyanobium sp. CH-040]MCP9926513.1 alpha/beta hydrolase [Cyanobium sp. CH-040]